MGEPKENIDNIIIGFRGIESSELMLTTAEGLVQCQRQISGRWSEVTACFLTSRRLALPTRRASKDQPKDTGLLCQVPWALTISRGKSLFFLMPHCLTQYLDISGLDVMSLEWKFKIFPYINDQSKPKSSHLLLMLDVRATLSSNCWDCDDGLHDFGDLPHPIWSNLGPFSLEKFLLHTLDNSMSICGHKMGGLIHPKTGATLQTWPEISRPTSSFWKKEART